MFDCVRETCASPPASKIASAAVLPEDATAGKPDFEEVLVSVEKKQKELENTGSMTTMSAHDFHRPPLSNQGMGENTMPTLAVVILDNGMSDSAAPSTGRNSEIPVDMNCTAAQTVSTLNNLPSAGDGEPAFDKSVSGNHPAGVNRIQTGKKHEFSGVPGEELELPADRPAKALDKKAEEIPVNSILPEAAPAPSSLNVAARMEAVAINLQPEMSKQGEIPPLAASTGKEQVTARPTAIENLQPAVRNDKSETKADPTSRKTILARDRQQITAPNINNPMVFTDPAATVQTAAIENGDVPGGINPLTAGRSGEGVQVNAGESLSGSAKMQTAGATRAVTEFMIDLTGKTPAVTETGSETVQAKAVNRVEILGGTSAVVDANPAPATVRMDDVTRITIRKSPRFVTETVLPVESGETEPATADNLSQPAGDKTAFQSKASPAIVQSGNFPAIDHGEAIRTGEKSFASAQPLETGKVINDAEFNQTGEQVEAPIVTLRADEKISADNRFVEVSKNPTLIERQADAAFGKSANSMSGAIHTPENQPADITGSVNTRSTGNETRITAGSVNRGVVNNYEASTGDHPASNNSLGQNPESAAFFSQVKNTAASNRPGETPAFNGMQSGTDAVVIDEDLPQTSEFQKDQDVAGVFTPESRTPVKAANLPATDVPMSTQDTVIRQITPKIESMIQNGPSSLKIELHPQELGSIEIRLVRSLQGVSVTFLTEQPGTGRLLSEQADQLRQSLMDAGVQLSNLNINQESRSNQQNSFFNQPGENSYPRWANHEKDQPKTGGKSISGEQAYKLNHMYSVDYLV